MAKASKINKKKKNSYPRYEYPPNFFPEGGPIEKNEMSPVLITPKKRMAPISTEAYSRANAIGISSKRGLESLPPEQSDFSEQRSPVMVSADDPRNLEWQKYLQFLEEFERQRNITKGETSKNPPSFPDWRNNPNAYVIVDTYDRTKQESNTKERPDVGFQEGLDQSVIDKYWELRDNPTKETNYDSLSFNEAFGKARKEGLQTFKWKGKSYGTKLKGETTGYSKKNENQFAGGGYMYPNGGFIDPEKPVVHNANKNATPYLQQAVNWAGENLGLNNLNQFMLGLPTGMEAKTLNNPKASALSKYSVAPLRNSAIDTNLNLDPFTYAGGGMLSKADGGFYHEDPNPQNVHQGIPIGPQNVIESGETITHQPQGEAYVNSNRYVLSKEAIAKFGLPKNYEGKTPADISKIVESKYSLRKNDKLSEQAMETELSKVAEAAEYQKAIDGVNQAQQAGQFRMGGTMNKKFFNTGGNVGIGGIYNDKANLDSIYLTSGEKAFKGVGDAFAGMMGFGPMVAAQNAKLGIADDLAASPQYGIAQGLTSGITGMGLGALKMATGMSGMPKNENGDLGLSPDQAALLAKNTTVNASTDASLGYAKGGRMFYAYGGNPPNWFGITQSANQLKDRVFNPLYGASSINPPADKDPLNPVQAMDNNYDIQMDNTFSEFNNPNDVIGVNVNPGANVSVKNNNIPAINTPKTESDYYTREINNIPLPDNKFDITSLGMVGANTLANSIAAGSMRGPRTVGKMQFDRVNTYPQEVIAKAEAARARADMLNQYRNAGISPAQFLAMSTMTGADSGAKTGATVAGIRNQGDLTNTQIDMQEQSANKNIEMKMNEIRDMSDAQRVNEISKISGKSIESINEIFKGMSQRERDLYTLQWLSKSNFKIASKADADKYDVTEGSYFYVSPKKAAFGGKMKK